MQLENELQHPTMKDKTMAQYLLEIKAKVDSLSAAGSPLDPEGIIHHMLDSLPATYQAFKTTICTNLQLLTLVIYSLCYRVKNSVWLMTLLMS